MRMQKSRKWDIHVNCGNGAQIYTRYLKDGLGSDEWLVLVALIACIAAALLVLAGDLFARFEPAHHNDFVNFSILFCLIFIDEYAPSSSPYLAST